MKKLFFLIPAVLLLAASCTRQGGVQEPMDSIVVSVARRGADISPSMYGIFLEEINHSVDGGLHAELVENRSFEYLVMPEGYHAEGDRLIAPWKYHGIRGEMVQTSHPWTTDPVPGWTLEGAATMGLTEESPMFESAPTSLKVSVDGSAVLKNDGFWGMNFRPGVEYRLRTIVKPCKGGGIIARLLDENGEVLAEAPVQAPVEGEWNDTAVVLSPGTASVKGRLALAVEGRGDIFLDYVSLMPVDLFSYAGGVLPFRRDVADLLADLRPAFIRWPGGCVVEGISLEDRFEWKKSLGDPASRQGFYDVWGYHTSNGLGYHEMLCFCEAIGADAMFVCNAGMACHGREGDFCREDEIQFYLDDCLDAIEYALGPADSEWGSLRAAAGHPEPLPLKYVEVGNENEGTEYERRYNIFHKAIKERYPGITVICNNSINGTGVIEKTDMIDPHWYVSPEFFFQNTHLLDNLERGKYHAYVGEYAVNSGYGSNAMLGALAEAAWIGGMERNGDLVTMTSYAPLIENSNKRDWPVNMISVNSAGVFGRSSYYVQKMVSENRPDYNLPCSAYESKTENPGYMPGKISLGTNVTATEFKDLKVTTADGQVHVIDLNSFDAKKGDWSCNDGVLRQSGTGEHTLCTFDGVYGGSYSIDMKFRRFKGSEGCYLGFSMNDKADNGYRCSIAGWDDAITSIERVLDGSGLSQGSRADCSVIRDGEWQDVRLDVNGDSSVLYIDGRKITEHHVATVSAAYYCAGYDERNSEIVLKIVNGADAVFPLNITLDGAARIARRGRVITLAADCGTEENSFEEPLRIHPQESVWKGFGRNFTYNLKPYSYTIMRIKAEK